MSDMVKGSFLVIQEAVAILESGGVEEYTLYLCDVGSKYHYSWMWNIFQDAVMKELSTR